MRRTRSLLISRPNAFEICSAILRQPMRRLRRLIPMTAAISSLEGPLGQDDGLVGSHIEDDICASPKPSESAAASKP